VNSILSSDPVLVENKERAKPGRFNSIWTRVNGKRRHSVIAIAIAVLAFVIGVVCFFWLVGKRIYHERQLQNQSIATTPATTNIKQVSPPVQPPTATSATNPNPRPSQFYLALLGKGDGVEHTFIRQLMAHPKIYGFAGDASNSAELKKWAGREAHLIAIRAGYVDWKFGAEIRVKRSGSGKVAYVLENDGHGNIRVIESVVHGNSFQEVRTLQASSSGNQFLGTPGHGHLQPYEYRFPED